MKKIIFIITLLLCFVSVEVYASQTIDENIVQESIRNLNINPIEDVLNGTGLESVRGLSFGELINGAIKGELKLTPDFVISNTVKIITGEFTALTAIMRNMLIVTLLCAVLKNLSSSFIGKSVSEMAFYVNFIVVIMLLFSSFTLCVDVVRTFTADICLFMTASVPVIITSLIISGKVTSAYIFNPLISFVITLITNVISVFIIPVINIAAVLHMLNFITEKSSVSMLADFIKKSISWILKSTAVLFMFIFSLQGISAPIIDNSAAKTAKAAINIVPVVGGVLSGTIDTVMYWSGAVRSGLLIAVVTVVFLYCLIPVVKLVLFIIVFKLTAAILQPIGDERVVESINMLASYVSLLLGVCVTISILYIFSAMIILMQ